MDAATVGITTTVPVEVLLAAGFKPVDLNNLFVSSPDSEALVERALADGFPQGSCAWLKGIYGAVSELGAPGRVVGVVRGDCCGTEVLLEAFSMQGVPVIPFSYPYPPSAGELRREMEALCSALGTDLDEAEAWRVRLKPVRALLAEVDRLCWEEGRVTGAEDHLWLIGSSDFDGDPDSYRAGLERFVEEAAAREAMDRREGLPFAREVRLGYIGVPPIVPGVYGLVEKMGARFVFNEVQRQFSMPGDPADLIEQYLSYTYPYTLQGRSIDINSQSELRRLDGLVHYVQSFCHRNMEDVVFNRTLKAPLLTVECDCPGSLGAPASARLENFVTVLGENLS